LSAFAISEAPRPCAAQPSSERARAEHSDLAAELGYRGVEPSFEDADVKKAQEMILASAKNMSPEEVERFDDEIRRRLID
jgi:hypothetical protein